MTTEGPALEALLRRLAETPAEFLDEPRVESGGSVHVEAVVYDVLVDLGFRCTATEVKTFAGKDPRLRNWLRIVLIGAWLAHDPWFVEHGGFGAAVANWLTRGLIERANLVDAPLFVSDPDRREELVRLLLQALRLRPEGESEQAATDRLSTVDSVERVRVLDAMREQRERAEKLRKEMEEQRAREAAARYTRE